MTDPNPLRATPSEVEDEIDLAEVRPEMVYREIRESIVSGRMAPGTRLVETVIAKRLEVSRTPVRSAFHRLQREGYAVAANRGDVRQRLVVAPITADDAADLFHIVGEIEGLAGYYAAGAEQEQRSHLVDQLRSLNSRLLAESQAESPDAYRAFQLDVAFHRQYVMDSAPPRLLALHEAIKPQAERYSRLYVSALTSQLDISAAEHEAIVDTIQSGDADAVQRAIQTNWRNAAERVSSLITSWGVSGHW